MFAKRSLKTLCGFAVMLVLAASITCISASALDNGAYTAKCTPHYRHPVTGELLDITSPLPEDMQNLIGG